MDRMRRAVAFVESSDIPNMAKIIGLKSGWALPFTSIDILHADLEHGKTPKSYIVVRLVREYRKYFGVWCSDETPMNTAW